MLHRFFISQTWLIIKAAASYQLHARHVHASPVCPTCVLESVDIYEFEGIETSSHFASFFEVRQRRKRRKTESKREEERKKIKERKKPRVGKEIKKIN